MGTPIQTHSTMRVCIGVPMSVRFLEIDMTHPNVSLSATNTLKPFTDIHSLLNGARFKRKNQMKIPIVPGEVRTHDLQTVQHSRHNYPRRRFPIYPDYYEYYDYYSPKQITVPIDTFTNSKKSFTKDIAPGEFRTHELQTGQHPRHMGLHNVRRPRRNRRKKYRQQPVYYDFYDY